MDVPCYRSVVLGLTFRRNSMTDFCRGWDWAGQIEFFRELVLMGAGDILDFVEFAIVIRPGPGSRIQLENPLLVTWAKQYWRKFAQQLVLACCFSLSFSGRVTSSPVWPRSSRKALVSTF
jgi:hypothetical protein